MIDFSLLNWFDICLLVLISLSFLLGLMRGFAREVISLITWIVAFFLAILFTNELVGYISVYVKSEFIASIASFLIIFVGVLVIGALVNFIVSSFVSKSGLTISDRFLGSIFGLVRGALIAVLLVFLLSNSNLQEKPWFQKSQLAYSLQGVSSWIQSRVVDVAKVTNISTVPADSNS